ncbi:MAG: hypothetical protein EOO14_06230 [Chitinophagaceae bacterium]|nr:MAG: hypothetical protein EOO14_06230 [Chitinophagaceae bacterium]
MRQLYLVLFLFAGYAADSQSSRSDFASLDETQDRKQITEALQQHLKKGFATQAAFALEQLHIKKEFAFLMGKVCDSGGKDIDFARFAAGDQKSALPFKGQETRALLKRQGAVWKVLALLVSPDDAACSCWWAEYSAPKELFDYTDYCR